MSQIANHNQPTEYDLPSKVAILYSDVQREYFASDEAYETEKDVKKYAGLVGKEIEKLGIQAGLFPGSKEMLTELVAYKPDMVLNLVDTVKGSDYQSSIIPGVLEILEVPYIGSGGFALSIATNKYIAAKLLQANGVPVADSQLFKASTDYLDPTLRFPLIAKLNETHGSVELTQDSVVENEKQLRERIKYLNSKYNESVLVEEYIVGREVSAVLLEGFNKKVYLGEKVFPDEGKYKINSFNIKWGPESVHGTEYHHYKDPILKEYVKKAFTVLGMNDYARFDIRIDHSGRYFFLDCNPNPFFGPIEFGGSMAKILDLYHIDFEDTLKRLMTNTVRDWQGKERLPYPKVENGGNNRD